MFRNKWFDIAGLALGVCLIAAGLVFHDSAAKAVIGVFFGIGAGLLGLSISGLVMRRSMRRDPRAARQAEIDFRDERNTLIRYRAKARAGDVMHWLVVALAFVTILADSPLWLTLIVVGVFLTYDILGVYWMSRYQKEM